MFRDIAWMSILALLLLLVGIVAAVTKMTPEVVISFSLAGMGCAILALRQ